MIPSTYCLVNAGRWEGVANAQMYNILISLIGQVGNVELLGHPTLPVDSGGTLPRTILLATYTTLWFLHCGP